jgi:5-(carboxyamino)imidazole ribonucleotide synthase
VDDRASLDAAIEAIGGLPAVLKTRRGGYDGKGQAVLRDGAGVGRAWEALGGVPLLLESLVPFDREVSVLAVRALDGTVACWPLVENHHERGILRMSRAPAPRLDDELQIRGEDLVARVLDDLDHVGVLAVELFDLGGDLLANEIAPRVHNSGHWTIEGAVTSQFENHLRAVLGWPLGSTAALGPSAMVNCIGVMPDRDTVLAVPGAHLHDYGKSARTGRKLGHVTVVGDDDTELTSRLEAVTQAVSSDG